MYSKGFVLAKEMIRTTCWSTHCQNWLTNPTSISRRPNKGRPPWSWSGDDSFKGLKRKVGVVINSREVTICFVSFASSMYKIETLHHRCAKMVRTNDPEVVWDKPNEVEDKWIQFIDENVLRSVLSSCTDGIVI